MKNLRNRVLALELQCEGNERGAAEFTDQELVEIMGYPRGYVPTSEELTEYCNATNDAKPETLRRMVAAATAATKEDGRRAASVSSGFASMRKDAL